MTDTQEWAIEAHELGKTFPGRGKAAEPIVAVDHVDLTVTPGTVFGLLGPNGAGKTTAFRMLTTLLPIDSGRASVAGFDLKTQPAEVRAHIGLVGQLGGADLDATGYENLVLAGRLHGLTATQAQARADELQEVFDLTGLAKRIARTFSGGQRRRLEIALGMVHHPAVLFLDEPTTGLDPQNRANLWGQVQALRGQGVTVVLTTHYLDEADALADELAVMDHGRVIAEGSPSELKDRYQTETLDDVFLTLTGRQLRDGGNAVEPQEEGGVA
ncbi:MAG: ATP-binding cassette domain-containing protein [Propionibacteriaceae bacterium]|nr:ATP-binding cassette domain-containing protein [Propionibacteriaceae bacterium]